ncbi:hypothetical protein [Streptacidiphilus sp. PAMC 29251]
MSENDDFGSDILGSEPPVPRDGRTVRRRWIVGVAAAAAIAIGLTVNSTGGQGSRHPVSAPSAATNSSSPAPPPIRIGAASAPAVKAWYVGGGQQAVTLLTGDSDRIATDNIRQDFNALGSDCSQLGSDVAAAQALRPLPDTGAQGSWAEALGHLGLGADACVDGVSNSIAAQLTAGTSELYAGTMTLLSLETQLGAVRAAG